MFSVLDALLFDGYATLEVVMSSEEDIHNRFQRKESGWA